MNTHRPGLIGDRMHPKPGGLDWAAGFGMRVWDGSLGTWAPLSWWDDRQAVGVKLAVLAIIVLIAMLFG